MYSILSGIKHENHDQMLKKIIPFFILLSLSDFSEAQVNEAKNNLTNQNISDKQANLIFEAASVYPNQTQFSIAIIRNGSINYYGIIRENDTIDTYDNQDRIFEIGSISKVFTSTLLAKLVNEGKFQLDDPVNDFIDLPLYNNVRISFKELANHTSGIPRMPSNFAASSIMDPGNPYKNYTDEKLEEYMTEQLQLNQEPGAKYEYSNVAAGFLGYVLCKIEDTDYQNLVTEKIFTKYGMTRSTTHREDIQDFLVIGLNDRGIEVSNWDLSSLVGAGGILSNVEDLSKFALAQFDITNKELSLTREKTFTINDQMDIGLGWHILKSDSDDMIYWHNGGTGGYRSSMALNINQKNAIIILTNVSAFNSHSQNIDKLCFDLMKTL